MLVTNSWCHPGKCLGLGLRASDAFWLHPATGRQEMSLLLSVVIIVGFCAYWGKPGCPRAWGASCGRGFLSAHGPTKVQRRDAGLGAALQTQGAGDLDCLDGKTLDSSFLVGREEQVRSWPPCAGGCLWTPTSLIPPHPPAPAAPGSRPFPALVHSHPDYDPKPRQMPFGWTRPQREGLRAKGASPQLCKAQRNFHLLSKGGGG